MTNLKLVTETSHKADKKPAKKKQPANEWTSFWKRMPKPYAIILAKYEFKDWANGKLRSVNNGVIAGRFMNGKFVPLDDSHGMTGTMTEWQYIKMKYCRVWEV